MLGYIYCIIRRMSVCQTKLKIAIRILKKNEAFVHGSSGTHKLLTYYEVT